MEEAGLETPPTGEGSHTGERGTTSGVGNPAYKGFSMEERGWKPRLQERVRLQESGGLRAGLETPPTGAGIRQWVVVGGNILQSQ